MDSSDDETGNCSILNFRYTGVSTRLESLVDMPFCVSRQRHIYFRL